jgi:LPXTG-motif cell wall-anchored protein
LKNLDPDGRGTYITGDSAITKQSGETGADGKTSINSIPTGYYEISEIKMPAGYIKVEDGKFYISVNNGVISRIVVTQDNPETDEIDESLVKNWTVVGDNDDGILRFSAARAAVQDDPDTPNINEAQAAVNATFKVGNTAGAALPNTGGPGTRLFTILGSILILGAGVLLWRRRRLI